MAKSLQQQFADWVARQPAEREYDYGDICGCAFHEFLVDAGFPVETVGGDNWKNQSGVLHRLPEALATALVKKPWTFGGLADRLVA